MLYETYNLLAQFPEPQRKDYGVLKRERRRNHSCRQERGFNLEVTASCVHGCVQEVHMNTEPLPLT